MNDKSIKLLCSMQVWEIDNDGVFRFDDFGHTHRRNEGKVVMRKDHIKAMEVKQNELRDCRSLLDFKRDDIRARDEHIKAQAKEIERLEFMIENGLGFDDLNDDTKYPQELTK